MVESASISATHWLPPMKSWEDRISERFGGHCTRRAASRAFMKMIATSGTAGSTQTCAAPGGDGNQHTDGLGWNTLADDEY